MEITGRLTANAIVTPAKGTDKKVTNFTIALNHTFRSKGELVERVAYVECDYWFGENVAPYLLKGVVVRAYGYPEVTAYISKKTGNAIGVFRLHAQDVELLTSSKKAVNTEGELVDARNRLMQRKYSNLHRQTRAKIIPTACHFRRMQPYSLLSLTD